MCRLYGFCATEPTKVECSLVHAQNALIAQSRRDLAGESHSHGWGIAAYDNTKPHIERQAWAAYHGEHFRRSAAGVYANLVIAHVRHATVGVPSVENTHPFSYGRWTFAHNGTVPNFSEIRQKLLSGTPDSLKRKIRGQTDSEHVFYYTLSQIEKQPNAGPHEVLLGVMEDIEQWSREIDPDAATGLNTILTDGRSVAGSRFGRSLYFVERHGIYDCEICGFPHIHHNPGKDYRAIVVASEPLTHERWDEMPERSVWTITDECQALSIHPF